MAKTCESCKKQYPDNLDRCPHCGAKAQKAGPTVDDFDDLLPTVVPGEVIDAAYRDKPPDQPHEGEGAAPEVHAVEHSDIVEQNEAPHLFTPGENKGTSEGSEVDLDATVLEAAPPASGSSEIDLGGAESNLHLGRPDSGPRIDNDETVLEAEPPPPPATAEEGSAVDLGSVPEVRFPHQDGLSGLEGLSLDTAPQGGRESPSFDQGEAVALGEEHLELEEEGQPAEEEPVEAEAEVDEAPKRKKKGLKLPFAMPSKFQVPSNVNPWMGGGVAGALAASLLWGGLWAALGSRGGAKVASGPALPTPAPAPAQSQAFVPPPEPTPAPAPTQQAAPGAVAKQSLRSRLDRGDFDQVLEDQAATADKSPESLTARGEARWLSYLQQQRSRRAPVKADDAVVKQALADLTAAKTPEALFWEGQIQETTGNVAAARKTYENGLRQYKSQPEQQRLFQAALDRLSSVAQESSGKETGAAGSGTESRVPGGGSLLARILFLLSVSLQPPPPQPSAQKPPASKADSQPPANGTGETPEAGFFFWQAVRLAGQGNYDQAIAALQKARAAHDERRFQRLRRSQNPASDPTEEIFLRSCDELRLAWLMQAKLKQAGLLDGGPRTAVKAVDRAISQARGESPAMHAVVEQLKKDHDVAAADPEAKDLAKDMSLVLAAKERADAELAAVKNVLKSTKVGAEGRTDPAAAVGQIAKENKELGDALSTATDLLRTNNYLGEGDRDIAQAVEKLLQDKKGADARMKSVAAQLKSAEAATREAAKRQIHDAATPAPANAAPNEGAALAPAPVPEGVRLPDPALAERHYSSGLEHYWAGDYPDAEKDLRDAIRFAGPGGLDARYFYYLALAEHRQGKDAQDAFRQAAALEQQSRPPSVVVNETLERVQGAPRVLLNSYRP
jgi:tetratricopeptide (TPR) repeat protein